MKNRVQKLPKCFWGVIQNEKTPMVFWFSNETAEQPDKFKRVSSAQEACQLVGKAYGHRIAMMAVAYIEADKQAEVISFSETGKFEWLAHSTTEKSHSIRNSIERARKLALGNIQIISPINKTPKLPISQIIKEETWTVGVQFSDDKRVFTYTCKREHKTDGKTVDSYVKINNKNGEIVIVPVVLCQKMTQTELNELAASIGYNRIKSVVSDEVTEKELEQWVEDNYVEPIEDFQAMKAAYGNGWEKDIPF